MKLKLKYTERFVGVFLSIALVLLISSLVFIVMNKKIFEKKIIFKAKLADANGLGASTPIYFKGFKIGTIGNFELTKDNYIEASLEIYKEYRDKIVVNSALWKGLNPVTNSSSLEFLQGEDSRILLQEGSLIPAIDVPEGQKLLLEKRVKQTGDPLSTLLANLQVFTEGLTSDSLINKGPIFRALNNVMDASNDLSEIASRLNYITSEMLKDNNKNEGPLFKILNNTADLTGQLKKTDEMAKKTLLKVDTLLTAYQKPDSLGLRMIDPTGEKLINPLRQTIAGFNGLIPKIDFLMSYMNTKTSDLTIVLDELKSTLRQTQITLETVNQLTSGKKDKVPSERANTSIHRLRLEEVK
ncbi:MAG: hypothetical protein LWX56_03770 [Ignavibacteria bacterium]|nr:hypothetical protein [Ignavibacteria bacterium]